MTITSLDGYRWLKNDIIRGNFQPDEKLRMSLLRSPTGLLAIGILCTVPIMARWKKLIMWQKTPMHYTR